MNSHKIARSAVVVSFSTLLSRILGFVRDVLIFQFFGKSATDAFIVAYRLPNLMRRFFGEGALSVSFIPVFSQYLKSKSRDEVHEFVAVCFTYLSILVAIVTMLGMFFSRDIVELLAMGPGFSKFGDKYELSATLLRIMFPFLIFISLFALAMGILNSLKRFFAPSIAPVLLNISIIFSVIFFRDFFSLPVESLAWGVLVGGALQLFFQVPWLIYHGYIPKIRFNIHNAGARRVFKLMLPALLGLSSVQISVLVVQEFASFLDYEGAVSFLFIADRLIQFPLGIIAIAFVAVALYPEGISKLT